MPSSAMAASEVTAKVQTGRTPKKSLSYYQRKKLSNAHKKRAAIEPIIGHIIAGHRQNRNFYKGMVGDNINIMLAAAGFNFKRMINKWKSPLWRFFQKMSQLFLNLLLNENRVGYAF